MSHDVCLLVLHGAHVWRFSSGKKDAEGWETVQRGRSMKPRAIAMVAKVSPVLARVSLKDASDKENRQLQDKTQRPEEQRRDSDLISPECEKAPVLEVVTSTSIPINNSRAEGRVEGSVTLEVLCPLCLCFGLFTDIQSRQSRIS